MYIFSSFQILHLSNYSNPVIRTHLISILYGNVHLKSASIKIIFSFILEYSNHRNVCLKNNIYYLFKKNKMLCLHFLFGDSVFCDESLKDNPTQLEKIAREHLKVDDNDLYSIKLIHDTHDHSLIHVLVEDIAMHDAYIDMDNFPCWVSRKEPRRTVWINPPSYEEKIGTEQSCPWNTHYTEFYQIYRPNYDRNYRYTVKYWKSFENIEVYRPTNLAMARYHYLKMQKK